MNSTIYNSVPTKFKAPSVYYVKVAETTGDYEPTVQVISGEEFHKSGKFFDEKWIRLYAHSPEDAVFKARDMKQEKTVIKNPENMSTSALLDKIMNEESDPNNKNQHEPGAKLDSGKIRVDLMLDGFAPALLHVANVTTFGAIKYSPGGWKHVTNGIERYKDAAMRHYLLSKSEEYDLESGQIHEAQVIWNLLAALTLRLELESIEQGGNITK